MHEHRRPVRRGPEGDRGDRGTGRASSSSTSTPRRRARRSPWAGTSTARSTLVVGTHTHVQTADERILPNGTAYLTDAGMTGPHDSIIGMEREPALARFLDGHAVAKFEPATGNPAAERRDRGRRRRPAGRRPSRASATRSATLARLGGSRPHWRRCSESSHDPPMSSLLRSAVRGAGTGTGARAGTPTAASAAPRRILTRLGAHHADPRHARASSSSRCGSRASCRTASVWNTGHLYFTLKDAGAQIRGVMFRLGAALPALQAAGRPARRGARTGQRLRPEGRVPDRLRAPRARRASARASSRSSSSRSGSRPRASSTRGASGPAGAAAQDRRRHLARRRGGARHHQGAAPPLRRTRTS